MSQSKQSCSISYYRKNHYTKFQMQYVIEECHNLNYLDAYPPVLFIIPNLSLMSAMMFTYYNGL